jgi:D-alanyl-lipoteichoic acid acyltransferase DltB (MBOAT superfamily)
LLLIKASIPGSKAVRMYSCCGQIILDLAIMGRRVLLGVRRWLLLLLALLLFLVRIYLVLHILIILRCFVAWLLGGWLLLSFNWGRHRVTLLLLLMPILLGRHSRLLSLVKLFWFRIPPQHNVVLVVIKATGIIWHWPI